MGESTEAIASAEDFVMFASGVLEHPSLEQVDAMLRFLSTQERDFAIAKIEDDLLALRSQLASAA